MAKFRWWVARWGGKKKPCNKAWKVSCCIARRKIWIYIWPEFWCDARFVCTRTRISTKERRYYAIYIFGQLGIGPVHVMKDIKLIIMIRLMMIHVPKLFFLLFWVQYLKNEFLRLFGLVLIVRLKLFSMNLLQYFLRQLAWTIKSIWKWNSSCAEIRMMILSNENQENCFDP